VTNVKRNIIFGLCNEYYTSPKSVCNTYFIEYVWISIGTVADYNP